MEASYTEATTVVLHVCLFKISLACINYLWKVRCTLEEFSAVCRYGLTFWRGEERRGETYLGSRCLLSSSGHTFCLSGTSMLSGHFQACCISTSTSSSAMQLALPLQQPAGCMGRLAALCAWDFSSITTGRSQVFFSLSPARSCLPAQLKEMGVRFSGGGREPDSSHLSSPVDKSLQRTTMR